MPIQPFPTSLRRASGGTVKCQIIHFNVAAQNGTWLVYQLVGKGSKHVEGWFACHSDVDPEIEIDKIIRVSGSPYEGDSGSQFHDKKTVAAGVLPVNRYDWGWYDRRCQDQIREEAGETEQDPETIGCFEEVGLVDYGHAEEYVEKWKGVASRERENQPHGIWMTIGLEYMFGRFGFDDEHTAARSFLWFTSDTFFTHTTFRGMERTLKIYETDEQRFQRRLREGYNFDGLESLHEMAGYRSSLAGVVPSQAEALGPYDAADYILHATDVDAIRVRPRIGAPEFPTQWNAANIALLNNILMSYLEKFVAPASSAHDTTTSAAASLFPKREHVPSVDQFMYGFMTKPNSDSIEGYDRAAVGARVKRFLTRLCEDNSLIRDDGFVAGLVACVAYLASEVLELANNCRLDNRVTGIVPRHIRTVVINDNELFDVFRFSSMYWYGGVVGWVADDGQGNE